MQVASVGPKFPCLISTTYAIDPRLLSPTENSAPQSWYIPVMSHGTRTDRPVPPELANAAVTAEDGSTVRLGSLWSDRPIVLAFVRHFG
jgi:hypothetical protein